MQEILVRLADQADLPVLTEIYNHAVLHSVATFDNETKTIADRQGWFDLHTPQKYPLVSAIINGQVVGWGSLSPFHPRPAYDPTTEFSVYVHHEFRGLGVGRSILTDLLKRAKQLNFHSVMGLITGSNTASLNMAKSFGFEQVGYYKEVGRKFDAWQDVAVLQLFLELKGRF